MNDHQPIVPEYPYVSPDQAPNCGVPVAVYLPTLAYLYGMSHAVYDNAQAERLRPLEKAGLIVLVRRDADSWLAGITAAGERFHDNNWTVQVQP